MCADCCKRCLKRFSKQTVTPCQENSCLLPGMDRMVYEVEDPDVNAKLLEWIKWDKNFLTKSEIQSLVAGGDNEELKKRLCDRMEFGTAGLRARMGAGFSQMNDLTIIQTTQGFAKYMLETTPSVLQKGVVIGYDARHNSHRFAELSASILLHQNIPVYLFSDIVPTPYVAYGVTYLGCDWGIMVTASHNPKEDNGYKVYFGNGAQIISPHDKGISSNILQNLEPWPQSWDTSMYHTSPLCHDPYADLGASYMIELAKLCHYPELNSSTLLRFTYTAMHGVGYKFIKEAFKAFNFKPCIPVYEQVEPNPDFPTVKYPNPEEGKSALDMSIVTADENKSTIILANDPDADRLALAEKQPDGRWHVFSGNEIGSLLGWWSVWQYLGASPVKVSDAYCLASAVSSQLLRVICEKHGINYIETLTGFKWMGNKAYELKQEGKTVLFAFEEAIGFMCGPTVLDKDGISAAMVTAEMAVYLASTGMSLLEKLEDIFKTYGYHVSNNSYFICHEPATIKRMFDRIRNYDDTGSYPTTCGSYAIKYVRDLTTGYDNSQPDNKAILPTSSSSQMITFTFENGCIVTLRTSGTEPKIKYYAELGAKPESGMDKSAVSVELQKLVEDVITHFYEPEKNELLARVL